jgi:uncharacterized protein (TIGR03067 family)
MRAKALVFVTAVLLTLSVWTLAVAQVKEAIVSEVELNKFQGSWVLILGEMDGTTVSSEYVKGSRITFSGSKVELAAPHQHKETIIATVVKLDETKNLKEMHWVRTTGPNAGTTMIAVYEFEGPDQYKICFDPAGLAAPKDFGTKSGTGHISHTWKRVKQ